MCVLAEPDGRPITYPDHATAYEIAKAIHAGAPVQMRDGWQVWRPLRKDESFEDFSPAD